MRRLMVGLAIVSIAVCSPDQPVELLEQPNQVELQEPPVELHEQPAQARTDPFKDLGVESIPAWSIAKLSGDILLELKAYWTHIDIDARIINLGPDPILVFMPDADWSMHYVWTDASAISDELRESRMSDEPMVIVDPMFSDWFFYPLKYGQSISGTVDISEFISGLGHEDGWYECTLIYDDDQANRMSEVREYGVVSVVGRVSFPPINVHIVDGKAVGWRPVNSIWLETDRLKDSESKLPSPYTYSSTD